MVREIELRKTIIEIEEGEAENVAGNVVWDAALCLINYLNHNESEHVTALFANRNMYANRPMCYSS
jgi:hypothetical protein